MTDTQANQLSSLYNQLVLHEGDKVLLWTNSSPNNSFAAQTITLSTISSYRYLIIECYQGCDSSNQSDININTEYNLRSTSSTETFYISGGAYYYRRTDINKTNSTLTFSVGYNNDNGVDTTLCVPYKIFGI